MSVLRYSIVLLLVLAFASQFSVFLAFAEVSEDEATSALASAEESVVLAYQAVLKAEEAGANVSSLLANLSVAGEYLAGAHIRHRLGDYDNATLFANLCYDLGEEVRNEAYELKSEAYGPRVMGFWLTMTGSLVGVVAVFFGSFLGWRFFKRRYYRRVLGMKPEVAKDES